MLHLMFAALAVRDMSSLRRTFLHCAKALLAPSVAAAIEKDMGSRRGMPSASTLRRYQLYVEAFSFFVFAPSQKTFLKLFKNYVEAFSFFVFCSCAKNFLKTI